MTYQYKSPPTNRQLKVAQVIRKEISNIIIRKEIFHPVFEKVSMTVLDVKVSPDLKIATIFINTVGKEISKHLGELLHKLSGEYRKKLCSKIYLRFIPQIRFKVNPYSNDLVNLDKLL